MASKRTRIEAAILRELLASGRSRYAISKATGINASVLCRFVQGSALKARNADTLMDYFGLAIIKRRKTKGA